MTKKWLQMSCADSIFCLVFQVLFCFVDTHVIFTITVISLYTILPVNQNKIYHFEPEIVSECRKR